MNKEEGVRVVQNCINKIKESILKSDGKYEEKEFLKDADSIENNYEKLLEMN